MPEDLARELQLLLGQGRYLDVLARYQAENTVLDDPGAVLIAATAATRLGRLGEGESLADEALAGFRRRVDDDGRMRCLNLLGVIAFERGAVSDAADRLRLALDLARDHRDALMSARVSNNLASAEHLQGRVAEARSLYREALASYQRLGDRRGIAESYHNLAVTFRQDGDLAEAIHADVEAIRHADQVGDVGLLAMMIAGHAETTLRSHDPALASEELDRAERLAREAGDALGLVQIDLVRALRGLELREYEGACLVAERAGDEAGRLDSPLLQAECAAVAARALRRLDRLDQADARRAEAESIFERLGATYQLELLRRDQ